MGLLNHMKSYHFLIHGLREMGPKGRILFFADKSLIMITSFFFCFRFLYPGLVLDLLFVVFLGLSFFFHTFVLDKTPITKIIGLVFDLSVFLLIALTFGSVLLFTGGFSLQGETTPIFSLLFIIYGLEILFVDLFQKKLSI